MEEAMHFLDELKDKYLHQVEQAIEDWDYQDFSPDKRCALLEHEEEYDARDGPDESQTIKSIPKSVRKAWVGLTPDAELENFDCAHAAVKLRGYESKLVAVCTPPGGIQGIPDADNVRRLLAQIPRVDAANMAAAFAARLQDDDAQHSWQVRAKAIVLMQMLVEIKPFAGRYIPAFLANQNLLQQLDALRTGTHKAVVREGARKLLSLIRSNGANPALIPKASPMAKPHLRHVQLGNKQKKNITKPAPQIQSQPSNLTMSPGKLAVNKVFKPEPIMSKSTSLRVHARPSLVMSPKVSQAVQASWRRRNSVTKSEHEDDNLMPYQKIQPTAVARNSWIYGGAAHTGGMTRQSSITTSSSRLDSGRLSAFSFVQ
ncbi:transducin wd40 repeat-like superfamily protein isoform 1 [Phytophthora cinnamomi]|uniref:transducin wd40 repeat-like superfamily protein isoform 1 n=1 Tax=Phytophthora cinnamomi TaxID=4785 RepID=UPI003559575D|nr:transducin wd40 repeat-like superfamily protein isoform 1 [Phytophthora cinnamomi]